MATRPACLGRNAWVVGGQELGVVRDEEHAHPRTELALDPLVLLTERALHWLTPGSLGERPAPPRPTRGPQPRCSQPSWPVSPNQWGSSPTTTLGPRSLQ